ncbi:ATP-binding protein [Kitasatospora sp. NPDC048239]|uniref:ATP-binding protein n=1 Tax=Kitasatospora sp. NPDC048239 TaxID=3364046 RepID=UPI003722F441
MNVPPVPRRNTTHDWARTVDVDHLSQIRRHSAEFAPGGVRHLILEVLAYAADEAECNDGGRCSVALHPDGSVSVSDDGRGTATGINDQGTVVRKPVMTTKDLRFFDLADAELLPDGHPRRGISVVAALSEWLVHTNRRLEGAWTQRYELGIPVADLQLIAADGHTGTTVHFRPDRALRAVDGPAIDELERFAESWPHLSVHVVDGESGNKPTR